MFDEALNETQVEIKRWIDKLDQFVIGMEATWGIGNLHDFCNTETKEKMQRQDQKIADAISNQDIRSVQDLVNGAIKGWRVMEKEAIQNGYNPIAPECMEIKLETGFHLRIAKNVIEARNLTAEGVYVWSLVEVARVLESDYTLINELKKHIPEAEVKQIDPFNFKKGDNLPEEF